LKHIIKYNGLKLKKLRTRYSIKISERYWDYKFHDHFN